MAKWLLCFVLLVVFQAVNAEDLKESVAPAFKKLMFTGCQKQSERDHKLADMGIPVTEYCQCSSDRFIDSLTEEDIQALITELATKKDGNAAGAGDGGITNPDMAKKLRGAAAYCLFSTIKGGNTELIKKPLVDKCKENVLENGSAKLADGTPKFSPQQLDSYCQCAIDKVIQKISDGKTSSADGDLDFKQEGIKAGLMCVDKLVQ
jgi:hypothetical protein